VSDVILHLGSEYSNVLEIGGVKSAVLIVILAFLSPIIINTQPLSPHNDHHPSVLLHGIGCPRRKLFCLNMTLEDGLNVLPQNIGNK
jgi:hypothetical protein